MNKTLILIAALLLCVPAPPAVATHIGSDIERPEVPVVPQEPFVPTGVIPVDEQQRDIARGGNEAGRMVTMAITESEAQVRLTAARSGAPGLIPYLFDDHLGGRHGGIGSWSMEGDGWASVPGAYSTAGDALGRYAGSVDSLLVLPAVDLDNGLDDGGSAGDSAGASVDSQGAGVPDLLAMSTLYRFAVQHANYVVNDECSHGLSGECYPWLGAGRDVGPTEGLYMLEFEHRQNLAQGRDGVQILVFTREPRLAEAQDCPLMEDQRAANGQLTLDVGTIRDLPCTQVLTFDRAEAPVTSIQGELGLTGLADWTTDAVDLTPWAGHTVWVALRFVSGSVNGAGYFRQEALFDQDIGFFGFQLGNVSVTGPAAGNSLRVRSPNEPSFVPKGVTQPTVARGQPIHFEADVLNLGVQTANVSLRLDVEDVDDQHVLLSRSLGRFLMTPGASHRAIANVEGLTGSNRSLLFTLHASADDESSAVEGPNAVDREIDRPDNQASVQVDVLDVRAVEFGDLQRPTAQAAKDDLLTFRMPVVNRGTVPATVVAKAQVIHAGLKAPTSALAFVNGPDQTVTVAAGETGEAAWQVLARESGQYNLFVQVNDERPFDATVDLLPIGLRAYEVPFMPFVQPVLDGVLSPGEWPAETTTVTEYEDIYGGGSQYVAVDGSFSAVTDGRWLWLAAQVEKSGTGSIPRDPQFRVFLDGGGATPLELVGNATWKTASSLGVPQAIWEAAIPLEGATALRADGPTPPRLLVVFADVNSDKRFPAAAFADGEGFNAPDGSLRDEMDSWLALKIPADKLEEGIGSVRAVSPGFGVDRAPPPLLEVDLDSCDDLVGWSQTGILPTNGPGHSAKWNCGPYGADGKLRVYEGLSPGAECFGVSCPPWSVAVNGGGRGNAYTYDALVSPAIRLSNVERPYLTLRHQYANQVLINDELTAQYINGFYATSNKPPGGKVVEVFERERVFVQFLDPATGLWEPRILLRPDGGYSTMATNGVSHPHDKVPYTEKHYVPGPGWWWPTGFHPHARAEGDLVPLGDTFSGSPWTVDRVPLFGFGHGVDGTQAVFPANRTLRLLFETFIPNTQHVDPTRPYDFGWRIEGLAINDGQRFARDLAVADVIVQPGAADVKTIGLGPGSPIVVNVTVSNEGLDAIPGGDVCVLATDLREGAAPGNPCDLESATIVPLGPLKSAERRNVTLVLPGATEGEILVFSAVARPSTGDDFPADNLMQGETAYEVKAHPDLAVFLSAPKTTGSADDSFGFQVVLQNRGNMPLADLDVRRSFRFEDGLRAGQEIGAPLVWSIPATLAVGETKRLQDILPGIGFADLTFPAPGVAGRFNVVVEAIVGEDAHRADNLDSLRLRTVDVLLNQEYSSNSDLAEGALLGTPGVWTVKGGSLVAGALGEMPPHANATVLLTPQGPIDLRGARGASLTLRHRFDLEASPQSGFDAGIVEVSTDGGASWVPLVPEANPFGLAEGYSSLPLGGDSVLVSEGKDGPGEAFTGSSYGLPGTTGGWIESVFDLGRVEGLSRPSLFQVFDLEGFPSEPGPQASQAADGALVFTSPAWALPEPNAALRHRTWSIHNLTYTEPAPHGGQRMWWSGSTGPSTVDEPGRPVHDFLNYSFTAPLATDPRLRFDAPLGDPARIRDRLLITWWEWRSGHQDGGSGGLFKVLVDGQPVEPSTLDAQPDGWTQFGVDLTGRVGQPVKVQWDYDSQERADLRDPVLEANRGWFIDDIALAAYDHDALRKAYHSRSELTEFTYDVEHPASNLWETSAAPGTSGTVWSPVERGAASRPGGWHVEEVEFPGLGQIPAWRFASGNEQGYPHGAESRLVTPVIDLADASGDVWLAFDQQYGFEAIQQCQQVTSYVEEECFLSALDGGAVEFQVFDPASGTFGSWSQVGGRFQDFPSLMLLDDQSKRISAQCDGPGDHREQNWQPNSDRCHDHGRFAERRRTDFDDVVPWIGPLQSSGYTGVEDRTPLLHIHHEDQGSKVTGFSESPRGHGTSFERFPAAVRGTFRSAAHQGVQGGQNIYDSYGGPWVTGNVSYVFTGESPGLDGWSPMSWDIAPLAGKQVRFAFHSFSNPSHTNPTFTQDHPGWSVANVRIESRRFVGQEVDLRVRLATDESLGFGEWSIDSAKLVGALSRRGATVLAEGPVATTVGLGETANLNGEVAALGSETLAGLHLAVRVVDQDRQQALPAEAVDLEVTGGEALDNDLVPGSQAVVRIPTLDLGFRPSVPLSLKVDLPSDVRHAVVTWTLVQDGPNGLRPAAFDDPANAFATWTLTASDEAQAAFIPSAAGAPAIQAVIGQAEVGLPVGLQTTVANSGALALEDATVDWRVVLVKHKSSLDQPAGVGPEETAEVATMSTPLGDLEAGESSPATTSFLPTQAGLYRVIAKVGADPQVDVEPAVLELLVGLPSTLSAADFTDGTLDGWSDASDAVSLQGGGSPDELRFRSAEGALLWGVETDLYQQGITYCSYGACNYDPRSSSQSQPQAPPPVVGLEGIAMGPPIDLTRVPQGKAFLSLRHSNLLEAGDGAHVELVPFRHEYNPLAPRPLYTCGPGPAGQNQGKPMGFVLQPEPSSDYDELLQSVPSKKFPGQPQSRPWETTPDRHNPLVASLANSTFAFGDNDGERVTRFDLSKPAKAACLDGSGAFPADLVLVNFVVIPVLRVGTLPGSTAVAEFQRRSGSQGWQVQSLHVTTADLDAGPSAATWAVQPGAAKTFLLEITNPSAVADEVDVGFVAQGLQLPEPGWVTLPGPMTVGAGQTVQAPVHVLVPVGPGARPGLYATPLAVTSRTDPTLLRTLDIRLQVRDVAVPDLAIRLAADPDARFRAGSVEPLHVTIDNLGRTASHATSVSVWARDVTGVNWTIANLPIGPLCPQAPATPTPCTLGPTQTTRSVQWTLPDDAGLYRLMALVDPVGSLLDGRPANNADFLDVAVTADNLPDLAVTDLHIDGSTAQGLAEEGQLLRISANLTNQGAAPANDVRLSLRFGSSEIKDLRVPVLAPGQTIRIEAAKVASRGQFIVAAVARSADLDANFGNDEQETLLRIRGHDLELKGPLETAEVAAGSITEMTLNLANHGNSVDRIVLRLDPTASGWSLAALPNPATVAPGQSIPITVVLGAPGSALAGDETVVILAEPAGAPGRGTSLELPMRIQPRVGAPNIGVKALTTAPGHASLEVSLDSKANIGQDLILALDPSWGETTVRLPAGGHLNATIPLKVPAATPVGPHKVNLIVRAANGVELARVLADVNVTGAPLLETKWLATKRTVGDFGERGATFPLQVSNAGNVPASARIELLDLARGNVTAMVTRLLMPGETEDLALVLHRAADEADDWAGRVEITVLANGTSATTLPSLDLPPLQDAPDLVVAGLEVLPAGGLRAGRAARLVFTVENRGSVPSPATTLHVSANGMLIEVLDVPSIAAGSDAPLETSWTFDKAGSFVIAAQVDGSASVGEASEDNGALADLEVGKPDIATRFHDMPAGGLPLAILALATLAALRRKSR
jgi:hypothetical protein